MRINLHKKQETIRCTVFVKMKLCIFIFASFKKAIDWKMIDSPLKEIKPAQIEIDSIVLNEDNSLQPLVISNNPKIVPFERDEFVPSKSNNFFNMTLRKCVIFKLVKTSIKR